MSQSIVKSIQGNNSYIIATDDMESWISVYLENGVAKYLKIKQPFTANQLAIQLRHLADALDEV
jgi:hypothetical protein